MNAHGVSRTMKRATEWLWLVKDPLVENMALNPILGLDVDVLRDGYKKNGDRMTIILQWVLLRPRRES